MNLIGAFCSGRQKVHPARTKCSAVHGQAQIMRMEIYGAPCRQQSYPAVTWDSDIHQLSVRSYSRIKLLPPLYFSMSVFRHCFATMPDTPVSTDEN